MTLEPNAERALKAARLLIDARKEPLDDLPVDCRPLSTDEAEVIQHIVLGLQKDTVGGWKIGRLGTQVYSAPIPRRWVLPVDMPELQLPAGARIELELATRFRAPLDSGSVARLSLSDLPEVADLVLLFEIVCSRYRSDAEVDELARIADSVSNVGVLTGPSREAWRLEELTMPGATLEEEGIRVANCCGTHPSLPLEPLLSAWQARCEREKHDVQRGELITWGSLSGIRTIPSGPVHYVGRLEDGAVIERTFHQA